VISEVHVKQTANEYFFETNSEWILIFSYLISLIYYWFCKVWLYGSIYITEPSSVSGRCGHTPPPPSWSPLELEFRWLILLIYNATCFLVGWSSICQKMWRVIKHYTIENRCISTLNSPPALLFHSELVALNVTQAAINQTSNSDWVLDHYTFTEQNMASPYDHTL